MQPERWVLTLATSLLLACGDPVEGSGDGTGSDSDDTGDSEASTGTAGTTAGPGGSTSPSGSGSDSDSTTTGTETGLSDPSDPATSDPSDPSTTDPTDPSTTDPTTTGSTTDPTTDPTTGTTTGESTTGSTTGDVGCVGTHKIPLGAAAADLFNWGLSMSMVGEGEIAVYNGGWEPIQPNHVRWTVDIPCQDTWYIWVRYFNYEGQYDSYFARLDDVPGPGEAIFEGDCDLQNPNGYYWNDLNWRPPNANLCQYIADPWTGDWGPGPHTVELRLREIDVVARIVVINDPMFVPGPMD